MLAKRHKIISAILAVLTLVVVQIFASPLPVFRFLIPAIAILVVGVLIYDYFYLREVDAFSVWKLVRVGLLFVAWFGILFLLPGYFARGVFLIASLPVLYMVQVLLANIGEQLLINEMLLTAFGLFLTSWGFQYYYHLSERYIFVFEFLAILLLLRASFADVPHSNQTRSLSALALSLFIAEIHWALTFLPFHFSVSAVILFVFFYVLWILYHYALFKVLTPKRVLFYTVFAFVSSIIIVVVTPWSIIG